MFLNYEFFPKIEGNIIINVEFGNNAASSRTQVTQKEIIRYPINSHKQLEELRLLFNSDITLIHSYNPNKEKTTIQVEDFIFETDTVESTAQGAIDAATILIFSKSLC